MTISAKIVIDRNNSNKNRFDHHQREAKPAAHSYKPFVYSKTSPGKNTDPCAKTYFNSKELSLHNVINSQKKLRKPNKFKPFWERLSEKTETKKRVCQLLDQLKNYELADKFRDCHRQFYTLTCGEHVSSRLTTFHCGHRACPFCAAIRSERLISNYLPKVEGFYKQNANVTPVHLVLTQKHYQSETLSDSIKRLLSNFRKLIRRGFWKEHFEGGLYAVEFTRGRDGAWHTHLHCLVFRTQFFHVKQLRASWFNVTGDSVNFKITPVATLAGGLNEVVKYVSKPLDVAKFKPHHLQQVLDIKNVRLFGTFGRFRTDTKDIEEGREETPLQQEKQVEGDLCEHCKQPLFLIKLTLEEQIEFEKHVALSKAIRKLRSLQPGGG